MSRRFEFEPAYLLSQRPYRETSLLLEAFTERYGRIGLVARGARGARSRLKGLLQPFQALHLSWRDTGELGSLGAVEPGGPTVMLGGERIFHGWYLNELLLRLLQRHDALPAIYRLYAGTLTRLSLDEDGEPALRIFEKHLLAELGYALPLEAEFSPRLRYRFDLENGARETAATETDGLPGSSLIALRDERFDSRESLRDARKILRAALHRQLGGRPLETPRLLREMRRQRQAPTADQDSGD